MQKKIILLIESVISGRLFSKFRFLEKSFTLPGLTNIRHSYKLFSITERTIFMILAVVMFMTALLLGLKVNNEFLIEIPATGGTINEGIVGTPRFINPVLAISDADKDITALVYAGLVTPDKNNEYKNLIAESIDISSDGKTYFVHIKPNAEFHDKNPVTADDILFTISKIKDPAIKSPRRANWEGVEVEKIDNLTVNFHLKSPYAPFMENLTLGILPKHLWEKVPSEEFPWSDLNLNAVGAGPYKVINVSRDSGGIPSSMQLTSFDKFVMGKPFITNITTSFFSNEAKAVSALISNDIDSLGGVSPENAGVLKNRGFRIETAPLPRVFALFFNQNKNKILADKNIRKALSLGIPKEEIISNSLKGFAISVNGPVPVESVSGDSFDKRLMLAGDILDKLGYKMSSSTNLRIKTTGKGKTLASTGIKFTIATADTPDLISVAHALESAYKKLGIEVSINIFEQGDLQQNIIRERKYETLLFGEVVGRSLDLFPFWHSSERFDPGLNVALYANSKADKLLDNLRRESNTSKQQDILDSLLFEFNADYPAAFIYAPKYIYVVPKGLKKVLLNTLNIGSERFLGVSTWYKETNSVWKIFTN